MTQTEMEGFVTYLRLVYVEKKFKFIVVFTIFNPYPISLTSAGGVNNKLRKVRMRHVCCPVSTVQYPLWLWSPLYLLWDPIWDGKIMSYRNSLLISQN